MTVDDTGSMPFANSGKPIGSRSVSRSMAHLNALEIANSGCVNVLILDEGVVGFGTNRYWVSNR